MRSILPDALVTVLSVQCFVSFRPQCDGPYYQWTRKLHGKTVTVRLTEEEAEHIREWIENGRKLGRIVAEMEKLSLRITDRLLRQFKAA